MTLRPDNRAGPLGAVPRRVPRPGIPDLPPGRRPGGYGGPPAPDPFAGYPRPQADSQLQQTAQGMIDPLIAALTSRINSQTTAGSGAIRGYTNDLAEKLAAYDPQRTIYAPAEASQAASDAALADRLSGGGKELAAGLAERLKGIGNGSDPAIAEIAQGAAQTGAGAGNALYGKGSASLADLIARGANAGEYASKQPGIARLAGVQQIGALEQQGQNELARGASDLTAKLPELVLNLRGSNDQRAYHLADVQAGQASATERRREFDVTNREKMLLAKMATETSSAKAEQDWRKFTSLQAHEDARTQARIDAEGRRSAATIAGENTRNANTVAGANARAAAAAKAKAAAAAKSGGLTADEVATVQAKAAQDVEGFYYGQPKKQRYDTTTRTWIDVPGTGTPPVPYTQALKRLMAKYPSLGQQGAIALLNTYYQPGEGGRPADVPQPSPDTGFRGVTIP